jgi:hypothetical protein
MRQYTDPTYLRTIHDGLLSGAVHKDNASALPQGLVGMYEEALPPAANLSERKKFLEFFSVWALLKKEVSAEFVLSMLEGWTEGQIIEYIAQYSKWFNSPTGGTYMLYHERLRAFVLQKISHGQFKACNEAIMRQCRVALQTKAGDEWERYALEFLSAHLLIQAMESKDGYALKTLSYNTAHWNRQLEISKGFEWSKRMLNDMMLWASKYDDDEVIECALNKVDLHHQEQNEVSYIVELVAKNDIETALQRIESLDGETYSCAFKFIIYLSCFNQVLSSTNLQKNVRKEYLQKLITHFQESIPDNPLLFDWYAPKIEDSHEIYLIACKLDELDLPYAFLFSRSAGFWDHSWIKNLETWSNQKIAVVIDCTFKSTHYPALCALSVQLNEVGKSDFSLRALDLAYKINEKLEDSYSSSLVLLEVASANQTIGNKDRCEAVLIECNERNLLIANESNRAIVKAKISRLADFNGNHDLARVWGEEARNMAKKIDEEWLTKEIEYFVTGVGESMVEKLSALLASDDWEKKKEDTHLSTTNNKVTVDLIEFMVKTGRDDFGFFLLINNLDDAHIYKYLCVKKICKILSNRGEFSNAIEISEIIDDSSDQWKLSAKASALFEIATALCNSMRHGEADSIMNHFIERLNSMENGFSKNQVLTDLVGALAEQARYEESIAYLDKIDDIQGKAYALCALSNAHHRKGNAERRDFYLTEAKKFCEDRLNPFELSGLEALSCSYALQNNAKEVQDCLIKIKNIDRRRKCLEQCIRIVLETFGYDTSKRFSLAFTDVHVLNLMKSALAQNLPFSEDFYRLAALELKNNELNLESIEHVLNKLAVYSVLFSPELNERIARLHELPSHAWSIQIKQSFSVN